MSAVCLTTALAQEFVTETVIHSPAAGQLALTHESRMASVLKITGDINAVDFQTLKTVTMNTTQVLDLSEATIHSYYGTAGSYVELSSSWVVGNPVRVDYPANTLPVDAFSECRDNSLSKWREGSHSLQKLILPKNLTGLMQRSISQVPYLCTVEVSKTNENICVEDGAIYTRDHTQLLSVVPAYGNDLVLHKALKSVADGVFEDISPVSVTFSSAAPVTFGKENSALKCAYIVAPDPAPYKELFPNIDCTEPFDYITVSDVKPGELINRLGNAGFTRADIRALRITGNINNDEITWLMDLPNIHKLDLSGISASSYYHYKFYLFSKTLTDVILPPSVPSANVSVHAPYLKGALVLPEGTTWVACTDARLEKVTFPASLTSMSDGSFSDLPLREVDMSKCEALEYIDGFSNCHYLTKVTLPPNLKGLNGLTAPIASITLPATLEKLTSSDWMTQELVLPESLKFFSLRYAPRLKKLDASKAAGLETFQGLHHSPVLTEIDLSLTAVNNFNAFAADMHLNSAYETTQAAPAATRPNIEPRYVVVGGTRYPQRRITGIKSIKFPPTVEKIYGLEYCDLLEELDLEECYTLSDADIARDCPRLKKIGFPYSLINLGGISGCPSLESIRLATPISPDIKDESLSGINTDNITVTVPTGYAGGYRMSAGWEKFKNYADGGYVVRFNKGLDNYKEKLSGSGMYLPGETVTVGAGTITGTGNDIGASYSVTSWRISGKGNFQGATASFPMPDDDVTCTPVYGTSMPTPEIELEITALSDAVCDIRYPYYADPDFPFQVYLDDVAKPIGTHKNPKPGQWKLSKGKHSVKIYGKLNGLHVGVDTDDEVQEQIVVTGFRISSGARLVDFYAGRAELSEMDLSGCKTLCSLLIRDCNIGYLNLGDCTSLNHLNTWTGKIERLNLKGAGNLTYMHLGCEGLTETDFSSCIKLKSFTIAGYNGETLDLSALKALETISVYDGKTRRIIVGDKPSLTYFYNGYNEVTSLDLDGCPKLNLNGQSLGMTSFPVTLDENFCFDLSQLNKYGFDITRMIKSDYPVNGTLMQFQNPDEYIYVQEPIYEYNVGRGGIMQVRLYIDRGAGLTDVTHDKATVNVEGSTAILNGFTLPVLFYNTTGINVATAPAGTPAVELPAPGLYLWRSGSASGKIIVR